MAYVLLSQSFGISKANLPVTITDTLTGVPAVILSSATGGLLNSNGYAQLDASGNLAVYVDGDKAWSINVDSGASPSPVGLLNSVQITAGAVGIPGVKADGTLLSPQGTLAGLSAAQIASLGAISVSGKYQYAQHAANENRDYHAKIQMADAGCHFVIEPKVN